MYAALSASRPEKDLIPPSKTWSWQQDGNVITGENGDRYTVRAGDDGKFLTAQMTWSDTLTPAPMPTPRLYSNAREALMSASEPLNAALSGVSTPLPVGQQLVALHRPLTGNESITYEWSTLSDPQDWSTATLLGARQAVITPPALAM
ncbi:hypothetical protein JCM19238_4251 [Vibrio ponticus]|nr:hypothetical protein JCM19238_4251 [Vibrio ponticus]